MSPRHGHHNEQHQACSDDDQDPHEGLRGHGGGSWVDIAKVRPSPNCGSPGSWRVRLVQATLVCARAETSAQMMRRSTAITRIAQNGAYGSQVKLMTADRAAITMPAIMAHR